MSKANEGFNICQFFEFGTFKPEDVLTLNNIGDENSIPNANFPRQSYFNLIAMPPNVSTLDDGSWLREATMDTVLQFLQTKYPSVYFVQSMDWSNKGDIVEKRLRKHKDILCSRRYLASCICLEYHWYWLVCDFDDGFVYYGDNYNNSADNELLETYITSMLLVVAVATKGARGMRARLCPVQCPEFTDDINNCGAYALCYLLMLLESNCNLVQLRALFDRRLVSQDKMPFLRYRLAMCVALGVLDVPIDYSQTEVKEDVIFLDLPVVPIMQFDLYLSSLATQDVEAERLEEWAEPVVLADLTPPHPLAEAQIWILYCVGTRNGINATELIKLCKEKCIDEADVYRYVNITCRHDEKSRKLPKSRRVIREHCELYYLTTAAIPQLRTWNWSYSRCDRLTLKKKITRRIQKKRPLLLLENGVKKTRAYEKSGHEEPWKEILCGLIEPYPIPMTTTVIKSLYKKTYSDTNVLNLPQQKFTLRVLQAIKTLETSGSTKRSKSKKAKVEADSKPNFVLKLPNELANVVDRDSITLIIKSMSANLRAACVEYMKFGDSRRISHCGNDHFALEDPTNFKELLARSENIHDYNLLNASQHSTWLLEQTEDNDAKIQFIEFVIRTAIAENIESLAHFKTLFFANESTKIEWVTADHLVGKWPRGSNQKKQKNNACTKFVTWLKYILYVNQCEKNVNAALSWEKLVASNDAESRLVCSTKRHQQLFGVDLEGYLILREPVYYGTLIEIPKGEYSAWFVYANYHTDPRQQVTHAYYAEVYGTRYLECHFNVRAGHRFFHNL